VAKLAKGVLILQKIKSGLVKPGDAEKALSTALAAVGYEPDADLQLKEGAKVWIYDTTT
jgi:hypothetical protein